MVAARGLGRTAPLAGVLALLLSSLAPGCEAETLLAVDVRTDLTPGLEMRRVRVSITAADGERRTEEVEVDEGADYAAGVRLVEWTALAPGAATLEVELLDDDARVVLARPVRVDLRGQRVTTVLLTRSCAPVMCPLADGDAGDAACYAGRCVDPTCTAEHPETCGEPECERDADCASPVDCAAGQCVEGACFVRAVHDRCSPADRCDVVDGCVEQGRGPTDPFRVNLEWADDQRTPAVVLGPSGVITVIYVSGPEDEGRVVGRRILANGELDEVLLLDEDAAEPAARPDLAALPDGRALAVWGDESGTFQSILARWLGPDGAPVSEVIDVNEPGANGRQHPAVGVDAAGNAVVVWQSWSQDGDGFGVYGRRLDGDATPVGAELHVSQTVEGYQQYPDVWVDASGAFTVTWTSDEPDPAIHSDVMIRHFAADGTPLEDERVLPEHVAGHQGASQVAPWPGRGVMVAWHGASDLGNWSVSARGDDGAAPLGGDVDVPTFLPTDMGTQQLVALAWTGDGFVFAWQADDRGGEGWDLYARTAAADGSWHGDDWRVNPHLPGDQASVVVAADETSGRYVLAWTSDGQDGDGLGVYAQRYLADGTPIGLAAW